MLTIALFNLLMLSTTCGPLLTSPSCGAAPTDNGEDAVAHVYVIRRQLLGQPLPSVRSLAHSALLLKTKGGEFYNLEFMGDSKAHLTKGAPRETSVDASRKVAIITMDGWGDGKSYKFEWERQLHGKALSGDHTPQQLLGMMQAEMEDYSVWKEEGAAERSPVWPRCV
jgi:hypothetical protein